MKKRVLLIATLDTKGREAMYLCDGLCDREIDVLVMDSGILGTATHVVPTVTREEVASAAGESLVDLQKMDRGPAIERMSVGIERCCQRLYQEGRFDGILAIGGGAGTLLATPAMKALPVGFPKLIVSVVACGKSIFEPFVGTKDIIVIHSVADILGLNPIITSVFNNAINAISGMVTWKRAEERWSDHTIGITMYGNTTPCVMHVKELLENQGFMVICFHANGTGGRAFEQYAMEGRFCGVIDVTTHELIDEIAGGMHSAGPNRLESAGMAGIPQVVVPGCLDFIVDGPIEEVRVKWPDRKYYIDNPIFTLIRPTNEEMMLVAENMAIKLNNSRGPITLALPMKGLSKANRPGTAIYDPIGDQLFYKALIGKVSKNVKVIKTDYHINDISFAEILANSLLEMMAK